MKYYTSTTEFNCGIDLHAHQMYVCLMDRQCKKLVHTNIRNNDFEYFLKLITPYRHDLTVCAECMFGWYGLADACQDEGLPFVLAHALYLHLIHGGKHKNDRIDSEKIAHLLRSNLIPPAYVYPAAKRPLRALLRQRIFFVWRRAELLHRIHSHQLAHNRIPPKQTRRSRDLWEERLLKAENHPLRQIALKNDLAMIRHFDEQILQLELELVRQTKRVAGREYTLLKTLPGIGESLGLTILYEIGDIERFPSVKDFLSYCRLVKGTVASAGKIKGLRGAKLGNPYLWHCSATVVCVGQASNPGLLNGSCGQVPLGSLTPPELWTILLLPKRRTRGTGLACVPPVSFVRKVSHLWRRLEPLHNLGTILAFGASAPATSPP